MATVLLFVEEPGGQVAVRDVLIDAGYRVLEAISLDDAENLLDMHSDIGLFLLGLDELTIGKTRELYRHYCRAFGKRVPMVVLTRYEFDEAEARSWGCTDVLPTPLDTDELPAAVERNLAR